MDDVLVFSFIIRRYPGVGMAGWYYPLKHENQIKICEELTP
jgi:hypothetical protein